MNAGRGTVAPISPRSKRLRKDITSAAGGGKMLLEVKNLVKYYKSGEGFLKKAELVRAVDDVTFSIKEGETLGLVGESGCGKSTCGKTLLRLMEPTAGECHFEGVNVFGLSRKHMNRMRQKMQIIYQDPFSSLDPRMTIGDIIGEPLIVHDVMKGEEKESRVQELLAKVGLDPEHFNRYPHEFSGGQRQRIGVARALALNPKFIVADEPVSALDVSIQAQIINLMMDLQKDLNLTYLFIAHDLSVVKHISDRVAVMYVGKVVELAEKRELFTNPLHPYTEALLSAVPIPDPRLRKKTILLEGDVPSPINPPPGCRFHTRCMYAKEICSEKEPAFEEKKEGHFVACHFR